MKYFVICRNSQVHLYTDLGNALNAAGHSITHDWSTADPGKPIHRLVEKVTASLQGIASADVVYAILPGGSDFHAELGAALAYGKHVVLIRHDTDNSPEAAYYAHPNIEIVRLPEIMESLRSSYINTLNA